MQAKLSYSPAAEEPAARLSYADRSRDSSDDAVTRVGAIPVQPPPSVGSRAIIATIATDESSDSVSPLPGAIDTADKQPSSLDSNDMTQLEQMILARGFMRNNTVGGVIKPAPDVLGPTSDTSSQRMRYGPTTTVENAADDDAAACDVSGMVDLFVITIMLLVAGAIHAAGPFERSFFLDDPSIRLPYRDDTVPNWLLHLTSIGVPAVAFLLISLTRFDSYQRPWRRLMYRLFGLTQVYALAAVITEVIKCAAGELRPDFLARCVPVGGVCTNPDEVMVANGRRSFPSGHATLSWASMVYLTLYLIYELDLFKDLTPFVPSTRILQSKEFRQKQQFIFSRLCLSVGPLLLASLVSLSRVGDNKHHAHDVVWGAVIGGAVAYAIFRVHHSQSYGPGHRDKLRRALMVQAIRRNRAASNASSSNASHIKLRTM